MYTPVVSCILSVNNGEKYLDKALESIINQSMQDIELIIINDASIDNTSTILAYYKKHFLPLTVIENPKKRGLAWSLNRGIESARGKYIARMDADDVSFPNRFAKQINFLERHPDVDVVGSAIEVIDAQGNITGRRTYPSEPILISWRLSFENPICHPSVMVRREVFNIIKYNETLITAQDYDLWCRLALKTKLANICEPLMQLRKHDENITYIRNSEQRSNSIKICQEYINKVLNKNIEIDVIQPLWQKQDQKVNHASSSGRILYQTAKAILASSIWRSADRQILRSHASQKLITMVKPLSVWTIVAQYYWHAALLYPTGIPCTLLSLLRNLLFS